MYECVYNYFCCVLCVCCVMFFYCHLSSRQCDSNVCAMECCAPLLFLFRLTDCNMYFYVRFLNTISTQNNKDSLNFPFSLFLPLCLIFTVAYSYNTYKNKDTVSEWVREGEKERYWKGPKHIIETVEVNAKQLAVVWAWMHWCAHKIYVYIYMYLHLDTHKINKITTKCIPPISRSSHHCIECAPPINAATATVFVTSVKLFSY